MKVAEFVDTLLDICNSHDFEVFVNPSNEGYNISFVGSKVKSYVDILNGMSIHSIIVPSFQVLESSIGVPVTMYKFFDCLLTNNSGYKVVPARCSSYSLDIEFLGTASTRGAIISEVYSAWVLYSQGVITADVFYSTIELVKEAYSCLDRGITC